MDDGININRYVANHGYCSRKEAEELLKAKRIRINGKIAKPGDRAKVGDTVTMDGQKIGGIQKESKKKTYVMFYKPPGLICSTNKQAKNNIIDYIGHEKNISPIGKLDKDSEGLILLTDEGISNTKVRQILGNEQEFVVNLNQKVSIVLINALEKGFTRKGKRFPKCKAKRISKTTLNIRIRNATDGLVKLMCHAQGYRVKQMIRTKYANISVGRLKMGKWKNLNHKEVETVRALFSKNK